jgi:hypothetical protein
MSITRAEMMEVFRDAHRQGYFNGTGSGGGGGGGGNSSSDGPIKILEGVGTIFKTIGSEAYDSYKKLSNQNYTVADAGKSIQNVFGDLGDVGRAFGTVVGDLTTYGKETVDKWRTVSDFGASFSNDAIGLRTGAAQTRMTFDEYGEVLRKNKDNLSALGGSVTEGARAFNQMSADFFDSGAAEQLRHMGMTTEQVNEMLITNMSSMRLVNLNDQKARDVALTSTKELAIEMDVMAKLTGKSRKEQESAMAVRNADVQYQAAEKLALMGLTNEEKAQRKASIDSMKKGAELLGPSVEGVVKEMATGGVRSKEASEQMAALGPAGVKLQQAVDASMNAKTKEEKATADRLMREAQAEVLAQQNSKDYLLQQKLGTEAFKKGAESSGKYAQAMDKIATEGLLDENGKKVRDFNLANAEDQKVIQDIARQRIAFDQKSLDAKGKDTVKGAETTKGIVDFESRAKDAGAALNNNLIAPLNEKTGNLIREFRNKQAAKGGDLLSSTNRAGDSAYRQFQLAIPDANNVRVTETARPAPNVGPSGTPGTLPGPGGSSSILSGLSSIGPVGTFTATQLSVERMVGPSRANGSLGATGNLFEDFGSGTLAMLHGKESVVTEGQMKDLMKGIGNATQQAKESVGSAKSKEVMEGLMSSMPTVGLSDLGSKLDQLNTNIMQLVQISYQTAENSGKQIRATKGLGGDLFA